MSIFLRLLSPISGWAARASRGRLQQPPLLPFLDAANPPATASSVAPARRCRALSSSRASNGRRTAARISRAAGPFGRGRFRAGRRARAAGARFRFRFLEVSVSLTFAVAALLGPARAFRSCVSISPPVLRFFGLVFVCAMGAFLDVSRGSRPGGRSRSSGRSRSCCVDCGIGTCRANRTARFPLGFSLHLAVLDRSAPAASSASSAISAYALKRCRSPRTARFAKRIPASRFLEQAFGLDVEGHLDPGEPRGQLVEGDDAAVREALLDVPLDPLVGPLLDDLGLELPGDPPDLRRDSTVASSTWSALSTRCMKSAIFELGPEVVGDLDRNRHVDRLLDRHPPAASGRRASPSSSSSESESPPPKMPTAADSPPMPLGMLGLSFSSATSPATSLAFSVAFSFTRCPPLPPSPWSAWRCPAPRWGRAISAAPARREPGRALQTLGCRNRLLGICSAPPSWPPRGHCWLSRSSQALVTPLSVIGPRCAMTRETAAGRSWRGPASARSRRGRSTPGSTSSGRFSRRSWSSTARRARPEPDPRLRTLPKRSSSAARR